MADKPTMDLDAKLKAEDVLYDAMLSRKGDRSSVLGAVAAAVIIHIIVLFAHYPEFKQDFQETKKEVIKVKKFRPPPPKVERQVVQQQKITRKVPIPDPTPDEPEPIREPDPEIQPPPIPVDADVILGVPEAPPATGPLMAGVGDVTKPVRIQESYVDPEFPELARQARMDGNVILQAIILRDGSVADAKVLRCSKPGMGFEEKAIEAVLQWRYEPATQSGRPVDVYFTVHVNFALH